jgi:predicted Zn-dependent protease
MSRPVWRWVLVGVMAAGVAVLAWLIAEHATPGQPLSLSVLVDGTTETLRTVDRVGQVLTQVPIEEEVEVGDEIATKVAWDFHVLEDPVRTAYVQAIVDTLATKGRLRRPALTYHARILDHPMVNAFAIPGGHVYVTTGMLAFVESEAELAAIMGHEMAHVDLKHCIERVQYGLLARKVGGTPAEAMVSVGYQLISIGYSSELEAEADRQGTIFIERAGYHPQATQKVFARLLQREGRPAAPRDDVAGEVGGMLKDALGDYFGSHPEGQERLTALDRVIREQRFDLAHTSYYLGRSNLATLTPRSRSDLPAERVTGTIYP